MTANSELSTSFCHIHRHKAAIRDRLLLADQKHSKSGWICIVMGGGFAIGIPGGFGIGMPGGFDRNTQAAKSTAPKGIKSNETGKTVLNCYLYQPRQGPLEGNKQILQCRQESVSDRRQPARSPC